MATMKDIAKATGLNISTVSRALNQQTSISQKTRNVIQKAAEEVGYTNRKLRSAANKTIALIVPELYSQYYVDITHLLQTKLRINGYAIVFSIGGYSFPEMYAASEEIRRLDVSGILMVSGIMNKDELSRLIKPCTGIPLVLISEINHSLPIDNIFIDQGYIIELIVNYLCDHGHKEIAYIGELFSDSRLQHLKLSCQQNGIIMRENMIFKSRERFFSGGYLCAKELLKQEKLPDAIVASYDQIAIGAMRALHEANLKVPDDIGIISIDDEDIAPYLIPALTSVNTPTDQMCESAINLLIGQIDSPGTHVIQHISLHSRLVERKSCRSIVTESSVDSTHEKAAQRK